MMQICGMIFYLPKHDEFGDFSQWKMASERGCKLITGFKALTPHTRSLLICSICWNSFVIVFSFNVAFLALSFGFDIFLQNKTQLMNNMNTDENILFWNYILYLYIYVKVENSTRLVLWPLFYPPL